MPAPMETCHLSRFTFHHTLSEHPDPREFERHCHSRFELMYVMQGSGRYIVEGTQYCLRPHSLILFCPQQYHYVEPDSGHAYERCVLHFDESSLAAEDVDVLHRLDETLTAGQYFPEEELPAPVGSLFERMCRACSMDGEMQARLFRLLLTEVLLALRSSSPCTEPETVETLGARAVHYLNEHLTEQINLEELAREFFVSKYYLCRAFKAHNGISVVGYVTGKRVALARRLMARGETASSAAYRAGFGDYSSFFRAHKKVLGRAPTEGGAGRRERHANDRA